MMLSSVLNPLLHALHPPPGRCGAVLLVSSSLPALRRLSIEDINFRDARPSQSDCEQIAFFRVWCLERKDLLTL